MLRFWIDDQKGKRGGNFSEYLDNYIGRKKVKDFDLILFSFRESSCRSELSELSERTTMDDN